MNLKPTIVFLFAAVAVLQLVACGGASPLPAEIAAQPTTAPEPKPTASQPTTAPEPKPTAAQPTPAPEPKPTAAHPKPLGTGDWYFDLQTDPISDETVFLALIDGGTDAYGLENHTLIIKCYSQNFRGALPVGNEMNIYWGQDFIFEGAYVADLRNGQLPAETGTIWGGFPGDANVIAFVFLADGTDANAREYAAANMVGTDTFTIRLNEWIMPGLDRADSEQVMGMVATFDITGIEGVLSRLDEECP
jgi:hypothetical protein